jgi:hypothetical protein
LRCEISREVLEGELPYSERLRILREAGALTADRGCYEHAHSRQDQLIATALGWPLTYENAYGHQMVCSHEKSGGAGRVVQIRPNQWVADRLGSFGEAARELAQLSEYNQSPVPALDSYVPVQINIR